MFKVFVCFSVVEAYKLQRSRTGNLLLTFINCTDNDEVESAMKILWEVLLHLEFSGENYFQKDDLFIVRTQKSDDAAEMRREEKFRHHWASLKSCSHTFSSLPLAYSSSLVGMSGFGKDCATRREKILVCLCFFLPKRKSQNLLKHFSRVVSNTPRGRLCLFIYWISWGKNE